MIIRRNMIRTSLLLTFATLTFVACDDQNFDWDKARYNASDAYEKAFNELYGDIDPNQSWDFSSGAVAPATRAGEEVLTQGVNGLSFTFTTDRNGYQTVNTLESNGALYSSITSALPEHEDNSNTKVTGTNALLSTPTDVFTIMPVTAQGAYMYDLYVKIGDKAPERVFTKNWTDFSHVYTHGMTLTASSTYNITHQICSNCHGSGIKGTCTNTACDGTGRILCTHCEGYYNTVKCNSCNGSGKTSETYYTYTIKNNTYTSYYLNGTSVSTSSADFQIVQSGGSYYLKNASGEYLYIASESYGPGPSNNYLSTTTNISSASELTCSITNSSITYLKLGNYYLYVIKNGGGGNGGGHGGGSSSSLAISTMTPDNGYNWTFTGTQHYVSCSNCNGTGRVSTANICEYCNHGYTVCPTCNGHPSGASTCDDCSGIGETFEIVGTYTENQTADMPGIKINSNSNTAGLPVQIFIRILQGDSNNPAGTIYSSTSGNVKFVDANGSPAAITDADASKVVDLTTIFNSSTSQVFYAGFEDQNSTTGSSIDFNDLTIAVFGIAGAPTKITITNNTYETTTTTSKRYMVEDMGFASLSSQAVANNSNDYTDIDFNDIVIDFVQEEKTRHTLALSGGVITGETTENVSKTTTATIRALGGTWDFQLFVGNAMDKDHLVFQKQKAGKCDNSANDTITFNSNYSIGKVPVSRLYSNEIYNTNNASAANPYDGNFDYSKYIATINSTQKSALNNWIPASNNIIFKLVDDTEDVDLVGSQVSENSINTTTFTVPFPEIGATPKIVAFPLSKRWQREKVHVSNNWFSDNTKAVDGNGDPITETSTSTTNTSSSSSGSN